MSKKFSGTVTLQHGGSTSFQEIRSMQVDLVNQRLVMEIGCWQTQQAHDEGYPGEFIVASIGFDELPMMADAITAVDASLTSPGGPLNGALPVAPTHDLETVRASKLRQISLWREQANRSFDFMGKTIQYDTLARWDIAGINDEVALTGALPVDFPGAWKATDNTYIPIPTVAVWKAFVRARVARGTANFLHSQLRKEYINDPARTLEEIKATTW